MACDENPTKVQRWDACDGLCGYTVRTEKLGDRCDACEARMKEREAMKREGKGRNGEFEYVYKG